MENQYNEHIKVSGFITYDGQRLIFVCDDDSLEGWIEEASVGKFTRVEGTFKSPAASLE